MNVLKDIQKKCFLYDIEIDKLHTQITDLDFEKIEIQTQDELYESMFAINLIFIHF